MKLTVLGSGVLIPVPGRGNSGYFLETEAHTILIDGGSGTLRRIADLGLDYRQIDTICYSHLHPDHTLDLVPLLFALKHDPDVTLPGILRIIGPIGFRQYYDRLMDLYGAWVIPEGLDVSIQEVSHDQVSLDDVEIVCSRTEHTDHSVTYRFVHENGSLFYSGDTDICDELVEGAMDVNVLLIECSFPDNLKRVGHMTPSECGQVAATTNCGRLILTHFYPEILEVDIIPAVRKYYQGPVDRATDGMEIIIHKEG